MSRFELRGPSGVAVDGAASQLVWPAEGKPSKWVHSHLDWNLSAYGEVSPAARDLLHVAAGAYVADRLTRRRLSFSRDMSLTVHVHDPDLWLGDAGALVADLLHWVSGDHWSLRFVSDAPANAAPDSLEVTAQYDEVVLLSGGLDSFCGAVDRLSVTGSRLHIGHKDAANAVLHAQREIKAWLKSHNTTFQWLRHDLREARRARENTTRTRSLLFMSMAVAAATGSGAGTVIVPENGYTSVNYPLTPSRVGAHTTKSTHPQTFHLVTQLLDALGIGVTVTNPYANLTKGELLLRAAANAPDGFLAETATTLSCAKLDSGRFKGGNPNLNCGLCYACLVRRGAYIGADMTDPTEYLCERLTGTALDQLHAKRGDDLWSVAFAKGDLPTEDDLASRGAWPPGHDLTETVDLVRRGRAELHGVPLP